jgi:hypothetical protein
LQQANNEHQQAESLPDSIGTADQAKSWPDGGGGAADQ